MCPICLCTCQLLPKPLCLQTKTIAYTCSLVSMTALILWMQLNLNPNNSHGKQLRWRSCRLQLTNFVVQNALGVPAMVVYVHSQLSADIGQRRCSIHAATNLQSCRWPYDREAIPPVNIHLCHKQMQMYMYIYTYVYMYTYQRFRQHTRATLCVQE